MQTHLAETKAQAVLALRKYGCTITAHLDELGLLGPHLSGAHAIWLDNDDLARLAGQWSFSRTRADKQHAVWFRPRSPSADVGQEYQRWDSDRRCE